MFDLSVSDEAVFESAIPVREFRAAPVADTGLPSTGAKVDGFRLETLFHVGTMTALYRATDENTGSPCTMIICRPHTSEGFRRSFILSRNLQVRIANPSLARITGGGTLQGDLPYAVRQYIPGKTVDSFLSVVNRFPPEVCRAVAATVAALFAEIADLVEEMCWAGYFRRCLWRVTLSDMVITPGGTLHLLAHGISHHFDVRLQQPDIADPPYSPTMDVTTILYALGVLIATMLDGNACDKGKWSGIIPDVDGDRDRAALRMVAVRCGVQFYGEPRMAVRPFSSLFELCDALAPPHRRQHVSDAATTIAAWFGGKCHT